MTHEDFKVGRERDDDLDHPSVWGRVGGETLLPCNLCTEGRRQFIGEFTQ
jgi:hypothetical protein